MFTLTMRTVSSRVLATLMAASALGVVGCGTDGVWQIPAEGLADARPVFVSPGDGQRDVPTAAQVTVRWSRAQGGNGTSLRLVDAAGVDVETDAQVLNSGEGERLVPAELLRPGQEYVVLFNAALSWEPIARFRVAQAGTQTGNGLTVVGVEPSARVGEEGGAVHLWPFSTLHVLFSEPIRPETVTQKAAPSLSDEGPSLRLFNVDTGVQVPGVALVRGSRLAFDPSGDLTPGSRYRLELGRQIRDLGHEELTPHAQDFIVDEAPLSREVTLAIGEGGVAPGTRSKLDGREANTLEMRSDLVGDSSLRLSGALVTQMPDLAGAGARVPMVIRKGQSMTLTTEDPRGLAIRLNGRVATGLYSGPLQLTLLTDSVGELTENVFASSVKDTPPQVKMVLDASLSATNPTVQAMLNQDLLHLPMTGLVTVRDGRLEVEMVGAAELDLLGMETARSTVTLAAVSLEAPLVARPPSLPFTVVKLPTEGAWTSRPSEEVLRAVFSVPVDVTTLEGNVWLERMPGDAVFGSDDDVPSTATTDGSTVFVTPQLPLAEGVEYALRVGTGLRSVGGATLEGDDASMFSLARVSGAAMRPPLVAAMRPGVPCSLDAVEGGLGCTAGFPAIGNAALPSGLPLELALVRPVDPKTVTLGGSVKVLDTASQMQVPGRLEQGPFHLRFVPDSPWTPGASYRLVMNERVDAPCGVERICDAAGSALNLDVLRDALEEAGGAPLSTTFTATAATNERPMRLQLGPVTDLNGNGIRDVDGDATEAERDENSVVMRELDGNVAAKTYLSGGLVASTGRYVEVEGGIEVRVAEGSWMFGTSTTMFDLVTDRLIMRPAKEAVGFLRPAPSADPDARPIVSMAFDTYVHAVNDTVAQALQKTPMTLRLEGRLSFETDGSISMALTNTNTTTLSMLQGRLTLQILPGDVRVRTSTPPLKAAPVQNVAQRLGLLRVRD